ncbi:polysialyltransferase family glycosyltransferase [Glutamicibacter sp. PS]|uniref:polysialyltransferase family glycosyltransferase n=1 Tax=Glutamicibacter sp. PS TaxID=3075634 RepID=UPI0028462CD5|nr:polysialyltransferase family glycosyltransferase [Glutamicibacter sp. PS]MDR4534934.1 alpha-2,8-polysialyltransferase family protein [Glutamicibacter sp. PS]
MIALVEASSYFQLVSLAAMADAGLLPPADERVLVLANGSQIPELTTPLDRVPGFDELASRFDRVVDFAALLAPRRPAQFNPRGVEDQLLLNKLLRSAWKLGDEPLTLVLESIQVNPARALANVFYDAQIWVHSDGLMSYGPTRSKLATPIAQRLVGTIHIDLVPGLEPQLLAELQPQRKVLSAPALSRVFDELAHGQHPIPDAPEGAALLLGQYLGSLGVIDEDEEFELHVQMLHEVKSRGLNTVLFKAHPSASATSAARLAGTAASLDLDFTVLDTDHLAETVVAAVRPALVLSCFSTGLATAKYLQGIEVVAVGTAMLLQALAPYQNSNRVPLSLVHALCVQNVSAPAERADTEDDELTGLLHAVSYCMQSEQLPQLRETAEQFLNRHYARHAVHFKRRRLTSLNLPPQWAHVGSRRRIPAQLRGVSRKVIRRSSRQLEKWSRSLNRLAK